MKFKKDQIVYSQGVWKCKVVEDLGNTIAYIPLEGYGYGQEGNTFHAAKDLFTIHCHSKGGGKE